MTTTVFTDGVTLSAASWANDVDTLVYGGLTAVAGTNTITATGPASFTAYASQQRWVLIPAATNTGAATLNISGKGARNIFKNGVSCVGGELPIGIPVHLVDDGTRLHIVGSGATTLPRGYIDGFKITPASTTATIATGQADDRTHSVGIFLSSSILKTNGAWSVGTGAGGLDAGTVSNSVTYHIHAIVRPDTGVVDALFSLNVSSPTLPANYTFARRIGSVLTGAVSTFVAYTQDGDYFRMAASVMDINQNNPTSTAAVATLASIPTGVNVQALFNATLVDSTPTFGFAVFSDLAGNDEAPSVTAAPGGVLRSISTTLAGVGQFSIRTNTSAQIRYRMNATDGNMNLRFMTYGWVDPRGKNS